VDVECSSFAIVFLKGLLGYGFAQLLPKVSRPIDRDREGVRNWAVRRVTKTTNDDTTSLRVVLSSRFF